MKLSHSWLYASVLLMATLGFAQAADTASSSKVAKVESSVQKAMAAFQVPGIAVAIIKDNEIVLSKG